MAIETNERPWGIWHTLLDYKQVKVKELVIEPGLCLSDQRHDQRNEHWYVMAGSLEITLESTDGVKEVVKLGPNDTQIIPKSTWHKACNVGMGYCHILEVQNGLFCEESDIERRGEE